MKRFITYLYEYEHGQKTKNAGFIRVDERNGRVIFQISVRNYIGFQGNGEVYAYVWENGLLGIQIGKLSILSSQTDVRLELDAGSIKDSGFSLEKVVGVGLIFPNDSYMASCWEDAYAEVIGSGRFRMWDERLCSQEVCTPLQLEESRAEDISVTKREDGKLEEGTPVLTDEVKVVEKLNASQAPTYELVTYQKMELNAIKNLPSPNWYLCNNRFLVHGFFNYGYLILKKTTETDGEKAYLGVPGIYEKPEMVMATLFGFAEFQTLPKEIPEAKMEEVISIPTSEQMELKQGTFGCWFIPIQN